MIIGFDGCHAAAAHLFGHIPGLMSGPVSAGNYPRLPVEVLARFFPDNYYRLYTNRPPEKAQVASVVKPGIMKQYSNVQVVTPHSLIPGLRGRWSSRGMGRHMADDGCTLVHGLAGTLPLNAAALGIPSVVTVHDLFFRNFPDFMPALDRYMCNRRLEQALRVATRVIAVSERTAQDVTEYYGVDPERIDVVYQTVHPLFLTVPDSEQIAAVKARYGLDRPYVFCPGTIGKRRNQMLAVRGLRFLTGEMDVVMAGHRTHYAHVIEKYARTYGIAGRVKFLDHVSFADLPALYAGAFCTSFASYYEGSPLPVLESLAMGTPVIIGTGSSLQEVAGRSVPMVSPADIHEWVNMVREMYNYPEMRRRVVEEGRAAVARFSAQAMAEGIMASYKKAINDYERAKK